MIISKEHPLILDTHIKDKDGVEHAFTYIDIKDKQDKIEGFIAEGEEVIKGKDNDVRNLTTKHWGWKEVCPYDYYIKGEKNPHINRINWLTFKDTLKPYEPIIKSNDST